MRKRKFFVYDKDNPPKKEMVRYLLSVDGNQVGGNVDIKSKPVGKISDIRKSKIQESVKEGRRKRGDTRFRDQSHLDIDARKNRKSETGGVLDKGIQLHRFWFLYLKLALELESLGKDVRIVTRGYNNHITSVDKLPISDEEKQRLREEGVNLQNVAGSTVFFGTNETVRIKVNRKKYEGWDLGRVLTEGFDDWWFGHEGWGYNWGLGKDANGQKVRRRNFYKNPPDLDDVARRGHSHLFEGHYPKLMTSKDEWSDDPRFLYVRIDKFSKSKDIDAFLREEVSGTLTKKGKPTFVIDGKPRPDQLQNRYNALVLSLNRISPNTGLPLSDEDICNHNPIYLRSPDEISDRRQPRNIWKEHRPVDPERLTVPVDRKTGKPRYSILVSGQKSDGIHHLIDVLDGSFGSAPPK